VTLPYEIAERHYQICRLLELEPGTQSYARIAQHLQTLPTPARLLLFEHAPEHYQALIPLCLLAERFADCDPSQFSPALQQALQAAFADFCRPLIQEQAQLIHDSKLSRYPYARCLLLDELQFHRHWAPARGPEKMDRDLFRLYLSGYLQMIHGQLGNPYLLDIWRETGWLQRWQLEHSSGHQPLPVSSPKNTITKYKLSEAGKRLYAEMEQAIPDQQQFFEQLPQKVQAHLTGCSLSLNAQLEPALRELIQTSLRHVMKKSFRVPQATQTLLLATYQTLQPDNAHVSAFITYTLAQELLLGTQNLNYRLNDVLAGLAQGLAILAEQPFAEQRWHWSQHAILDIVMEIYESFSLADNALKSFLLQYQQAREQQAHQQYQALEIRLAPLLSA